VQVLYDADGDGTIDHDEYVQTNRLVQRCLLDDFDPSNAAETAEADWEVDSAGHDHLDYMRFSMSWFQLADLWTEGISADQYASFLEDVMACIAEVGPDGTLRLRKENDIRTLASMAREAELAQASAEAEREAARLAEEKLAAERERARIARERRWSKAPTGFVELYIPPEHRKSTRVPQQRRRKDVRPNAPNTATWLLDGMVGVSPADSSMLWHVQGVAQAAPVHTPAQRKQHMSNSARMSKRIKAERDTPKEERKPSLPADATVAAVSVEAVAPETPAPTA